MNNVKSVVGMHATIAYASDCRPCTVVKVSASGSKVTVRSDNAVRVDKNGMSDTQEYEYSDNPEGALTVFHRQGDGRYGKPGYRLVLGERRYYYDFSF